MSPQPRDLSAPSLHTISVRMFSHGQGMHLKAKFSPPSFLHSADAILIYIHGFNVTAFQALNAYGGFRSRLTRLETVQQAGFLWPGDSNFRSSSETAGPGLLSYLISGMLYSRQIPNAEKSGLRLADAVNAEVTHRRAQLAAGMPLRPLKIYIVAHSLGCRVALEFLSGMQGAQKLDVSFPLVVLMAAAVPLYTVLPDGALERALFKPKEVLIYSSKRDIALGLFFRPGQIPDLLVRDLFRIKSQAALGRTGINVVDKIHHRPGPRGHSKYWNDKEIASEVEEAIATGTVKALAPATTRDLGRRVDSRPLSEPPKLNSIRSLHHVS